MVTKKAKQFFFEDLLLPTDSEWHGQLVIPTKSGVHLLNVMIMRTVMNSVVAEILHRWMELIKGSPVGGSKREQYANVAGLSQKTGGFFTEELVNKVFTHVNRELRENAKWEYFRSDSFKRYVADPMEKVERVRRSIVAFVQRNAKPLQTLPTQQTAIKVSYSLDLTRNKLLQEEAFKGFAITFAAILQENSTKDKELALFGPQYKDHPLQIFFRLVCGFAGMDNFPQMMAGFFGGVTAAAQAAGVGAAEGSRPFSAEQDVFG